MKYAKINHHLERAAHFRHLATWDGSGAPGQPDPGVTQMLPENAIRRAEYHEAKAALLIAEGARRAAARRARKKR